MNRKRLFSFFVVLILAATAAFPALASDQGVGSELAKVRAATAAYHSLDAAIAAQYNLVPGLDYCFADPSVGGMGFHYINTSLLDTTVNPLQPEAIVYAPTKNGRLRLAAVEYIVPIDAWDATHSAPPTLFGQTFEVNSTLGVYTLHAWIWKHNSLGMFSDWNPKVTCR